MKILIIGPLGAGKSSLAYAINKKMNIPRLNLDEVCRINNTYRTESEQLDILNNFLKTHSNWVMEGSQKSLYSKVCPDIIIDMRVNRLCAIWRFTKRFYVAKGLIGKNIASDLPVQAYHYRKITLQKILEWDKSNKEINYQIGEFLKDLSAPVIICKKFKDYQKVFDYILKFMA